MIPSVIKAIGVGALVVPLVSGCYIGQDAATLTQGNSGNGTAVEVPGMKVDNATLVAGNPDSGKAAFLATLYNPEAEPDALIGITANGGKATLLPDPVPIPPMSAVKIQTGADAQADFGGLETGAGSYADVQLVFKNAGTADFPALVVPPYGYYLEAAPEGTDEVVKVVIVEESEMTHGG